MKSFALKITTTNPVLVKATVFILLTALLLFSIIFIISSGMSVLLSILCPSSYYQNLLISLMFLFTWSLCSGPSKEVNDWIKQRWQPTSNRLSLSNQYANHHASLPLLDRLNSNPDTSEKATSRNPALDQFITRITHTIFLQKPHYFSTDFSAWRLMLLLLS